MKIDFIGFYHENNQLKRMMLFIFKYCRHHDKEFYYYNTIFIFLVAIKYRFTFSKQISNYHYILLFQLMLVLSYQKVEVECLFLSSKTSLTLQKFLKKRVLERNKNKIMFLNKISKREFVLQPLYQTSKGIKLLQKRETCIKGLHLMKKDCTNP